MPLVMSKSNFRPQIFRSVFNLNYCIKIFICKYNLQNNIFIWRLLNSAFCLCLYLLLKCWNLWLSYLGEWIWSEMITNGLIYGNMNLKWKGWKCTKVQNHNVQSISNVSPYFYIWRKECNSSAERSVQQENSFLSGMGNGNSKRQSYIAISKSVSAFY